MTVPQEHRCKCSFATARASNFKRHAKTCRASRIIIALEAELEQLRSAISIAPPAIAIAVALPKSLPSVRIVGQECYAHVTPQSYSTLIKQPLTAMAALYRLVRQNHENRNVLIPNKRDRFIRVRMLAGWTYIDRKTTIADMAHAIANKIAMAADSDAVKAITPADAIARWTAHHDSICRDPARMSEAALQLEMVIYSERM